MNIAGLVVETETLLERYIEGYRDLRVEERDMIMCFSWIWPLFEERCQDREANREGIERFARAFEGRLALPTAVAAAFAFYRERYFIAQDASDRLEALCAGRLGDQMGREKVRVRDGILAALRADNPSPRQVLEGTLLVIYRLRNNLFHGSKNIGFEDQRGNFFHAVSVLNQVILLN